MRQVAKKGLITVAAAGGVLALTGGSAFADAAAEGAAANSPGVVSGNNIQAPVHIPVNLCGNTVNVVGLLNPAMGNACGNGAGDEGSGGSAAQGSAVGSPGVGSGNDVQIPIDIPVNGCGNSVDVVGLLNPAMGNECGNPSPEAPDDEQPNTPEEPENPGGETPEEPNNPEQPDNPGQETPEQPTTPGDSTPEQPVDDTSVRPQEVAQHEARGELAETGGDHIGLALSAGAGLLLGGAVLYRRARVAQQR
jgi:hypothetical protein